MRGNLMLPAFLVKRARWAKQTQAVYAKIRMKKRVNRLRDISSLIIAVKWSPTTLIAFFRLTTK
ncbi:hypothetical protein CGI94_21905 [Vibrio parahaemolyticus]|nr:hypothetical protein CGI94_21905 [Vibrio parahaemolyticus]